VVACDIHRGNHSFMALEWIPRKWFASTSVDSKIMKLGLKKDGSLAVPLDGSLAGWYKGWPTPGEVGPPVIVGHQLHKYVKDIVVFAKVIV
jgi:hypothetical protein